MHVNRRGQVAQVVGVSSHIAKGFKFDTWSGHITRFWYLGLGFQPPWGGYGRQPINVCLSPSLSKISIKTS